MQVAIIGTGNVGKALGRSFTKAGHTVTFAARDAEKARAVAAEAGGVAAATPAAAARDADVVVLAVPFNAVDSVASELGAHADGTVVVDATNPLKPDYSGLATEGGPSGAERLAAALPNAHVVKAFNTLFASAQADTATHGVVLDGFFATDDAGAAATVAKLVGSIGLRPVNVGTLARARELEALGFLNITLQLQGGDWRSAFVLVGAPASTTPAES